MTVPTSTLFSQSDERPLVVREGMDAGAALQAIHAWAESFGALQPYQADCLATPLLDVGKLAEHVKKLMRRDMLLTSNCSGLSLVLAGLAIPIKICGVELPHAITFEALTSRDAHISLRLELKPTLDARDADMLHMLAPALAVFMLEHNAPSGTPACLAELPEATKMPVVPPAMLDAARQLPSKGYNDDKHIGEVLVAARRALQQVMCHVPSLDYLKLRGATLEQWLGIATHTLGDISAMEEEVHSKVAQMKRALEETADEMVGMLRSCRARFINTVARGGM